MSRPKALKLQTFELLNALFVSIPSSFRAATYFANASQPELYGLAFETARNGSEVASNLFITLPDPNSAVSGWLFEFRQEELLKDHAIASRRWIFRSADDVD
jgi:hypothetical protein